MNPINAITDPKSQLAVMRAMGTAIDLGIGQKAAGGVLGFVCKKVDEFLTSYKLAFPQLTVNRRIKESICKRKVDQCGHFLTLLN